MPELSQDDYEKDLSIMTNFLVIKYNLNKWSDWNSLAIDTQLEYLYQVLKDTKWFTSWVPNVLIVRFASDESLIHSTDCLNKEKIVPNKISYYLSTHAIMYDLLFHLREHFD